MSITFSTCFYIIHSKFPKEIYIEWLNYFISIVNEFNLVIYTDLNTLPYIKTNNNPNIKVILKPLETFYNYQYKDKWIENHNKNFLLNNHKIASVYSVNTSWELNMLWNEKVHFVKETKDNKYFETEMYGWCDAGYFRNNPESLSVHALSKWANPDKIKLLNPTKIHYALVNNDTNFINRLILMINNRNNIGLPYEPITPDQHSIAGGFFILHQNKIDWWATLLDKRIQLYFDNNYLIKDDQMIVADCLLHEENRNHFDLHTEHLEFDNWFMFQRILQ